MKKLLEFFNAVSGSSKSSSSDRSNDLTTLGRGEDELVAPVSSRNGDGSYSHKYGRFL